MFACSVAESKPEYREDIMYLINSFIQNNLEDYDETK